MPMYHRVAPGTSIGSMTCQYVSLAFCLCVGVAFSFKPTMSSAISKSRRGPGLIEVRPSAKHVASFPRLTPLIVQTSSVHLPPATPPTAHGNISANFADSTIVFIALDRARASERTDVTIPILILPWLTPTRRAAR